MEYMQKREWLLLESEKDGIKKFQILDIVVDHIVELKARCPSVVIADGMEEAILPPDGNDLLAHENEEEATSRAEDDIMELEKKGELEGLLVAAQFSETEDDGEVDDEGREDGRPGGEGCPTALIMYKVRREGWQRYVLEDEVGEVEHGGREESKVDNATAHVARVFE